MASHILSAFLVPKKISRKISSTLLKFWWKSGLLRKPNYWRKEEVLQRRKEDRGVGLAKQVWRLHDNPNLLVSRIITGKYGASPIIKATTQSCLHSSSWGFRGLVKATTAIKKGFSFNVRNGTKVKIFEDRWVGSTTPIIKRSWQGHRPQKVFELLTPQVFQLLSRSGDFSTALALEMF